jgi:hypothetical protein
MTRRKWGRLLTWLALPLLATSLYCFYKGIDLGFTSEEGSKYSIPAMRADPHYSPEDVRKEEIAFRKMARSADRWMDVAELTLLMSVGSGIGAYILLRPRPQEDLPH